MRIVDIVIIGGFVGGDFKGRILLRDSPFFRGLNLFPLVEKGLVEKFLFYHS